MAIAAARSALGRAMRTKSLPVGGSAKADGLKRCLTLSDVVGFGMGATVGGGIFVATGAAAQQAGPAVVFSFALAASGCACSGLCYAEMSSLAPCAGSSYSFNYFALGELPAFIVGLVNIVGSVLSGAAVARGWASYMRLLLIEMGFPSTAMGSIALGPFAEASPAAAMLVVIIACVNCCGTRATSTINNLATALSVSLLLAFVGGAAPSVDPARWQPFLPQGVSGVLRGASTTFFAYLGFDVLSCLGEEAKNPEIVPKGIFVTLVLSTLLYCATAVVFTGLVARDEISLGAPLAHASRLRGLNVVAVTVAFAAVGSTMTTVISCVLGAPRVLYAMAQDGLVPVALARVSGGGTPVRTLFLTALPTALCAGALEFTALAEMVSAGALCTFSSVCASLILLRCPAPVIIPHHFFSKAQVTSAETAGASVIGRTQEAASEHVNNQAPRKLALHGSNPQLAHDLGRSLGAYTCLCFATGLLLRVAAERGTTGVAAWEGATSRLALQVLTALSALGAAVAAWLTALPFRSCGGSGADNANDSDGFHLPFMPAMPLLGILMNMFLLSELPVTALWQTLVLGALCASVYFAYAAPRSRLDGLSL